MKELQITGPDQVKTKYDIRQVLKAKKHRGKFTLHKGQKLYEMICVSEKGEPVPGLDPVTGDFDPELAIVRPATYCETVTHIGTRVVPELGAVLPGIQRTLQLNDGNLYEVAINEKNARRKITERYFPHSHKTPSI